MTDVSPGGFSDGQRVTAVVTNGRLTGRQQLILRLADQLLRQWRGREDATDKIRLFMMQVMTGCFRRTMRGLETGLKVVTEWDRRTCGARDCLCVGLGSGS